MKDRASALREAREKAGLKQSDVAAKLGKTRAWVSRVELGGVTTTESLDQWAALFGLEVRLAPANEGQEAEGAQASLASENPGLFPEDVAFELASEEDLGAAMRELREAAGISRGDMAQRLSVTTATISNIERAQRTTTTRILLSWLSECAARLVVVRGHPVELSPLPQDPLVEQLMRAIPRLMAVHKRMLAEQIALMEGTSKP